MMERESVLLLIHGLNAVCQPSTNLWLCKRQWFRP